MHAPRSDSVDSECPSESAEITSPPPRVSNDARTMGAILAYAFDAPRTALKIILALFILNTLGYYAGGKIEGKLAIDHRLAAMLLWGGCYGIGFGAGLGVAFHVCQAQARALISGVVNSAIAER